MAKLCSQQDCTSCMACYNACPFEAIIISKSSLDVFVPHIDVGKCRDCGKCEKSCPILTPSTFKEPIECYAIATLNEEDVATCSSGGAATLLSRDIIAKGGVVYGATAIDGIPRFIRCATDQELEKLKGSKYVYCTPQLIYREVLADLKSGLECLFVGLPCNIAGLLNFLGKDYYNLTTVDLVCHGAPPFEYLYRHLESNGVNMTDVASITFRGERDYFTSAYSGDGKRLYSKSMHNDAYLSAFMKGIIFRNSCYNCKFARPQRVSDITIGDFWGAPAGCLDGYNGKISLMLINTSKGLDTFTKIKSLCRWEKHTIEEATAGNSQLKHPTPVSAESSIFHEVYESTRNLDAAFKASGVYSVIRRNKLRTALFALPIAILKLTGLRK